MGSRSLLTAGRRTRRLEGVRSTRHARYRVGEKENPGDLRHRDSGGCQVDLRGKAVVKIVRPHRLPGTGWPEGHQCPTFRQVHLQAGRHNRRGERGSKALQAGQYEQLSVESWVRSSSPSSESSHKTLDAPRSRDVFRLR